MIPFRMSMVCQISEYYGADDVADTWLLAIRTLENCSPSHSFSNLLRSPWSTLRHCVDGGTVQGRLKSSGLEAVPCPRCPARSPHTPAPTIPSETLCGTGPRLQKKGRQHNCLFLLTYKANSIF